MRSAIPAPPVNAALQPISRNGNPRQLTNEAPGTRYGLERPEDDYEDDGRAEADGCAHERDLAAPGAHEVREDALRKHRGRDCGKNDKQNGDTDCGEEDWKAGAQRLRQISVVAAFEKEHPGSRQAARLCRYAATLAWQRGPSARRAACGILTNSQPKHTKLYGAGPGQGQIREHRGISY